MCDIENQFSRLFKDRYFLLAAVTHPKFKLTGIEDSSLRAQCRPTRVLEQAVIGCLNSDHMATTSNAASSATTSDEDFFNFTSVSTLPSQKHVEFLNDKKKELAMLDIHPIIK